MAAPLPVGGAGSQELRDALAFNDGRPRRNSVEQARAIHAFAPSGPAGSAVSAAQIEGLRAAGGVFLPALMSLLPADSERPWSPDLRGGRVQIRTGRNFEVADAHGGKPFKVRVHTNDQTRGEHSGENAATNPVVRLEQGKRALMSEPNRWHTDSRTSADWLSPKNRGKPSAERDERYDVLTNKAHIPVMFPTLESAAPGSAAPRGSMPPVVADHAAPGPSHLRAGPPAFAPVASTPPVRAVAATVTASAPSIAGMPGFRS